jgi:hypothetical protein
MAGSAAPTCCGAASERYVLLEPSLSELTRLTLVDALAGALRRNASRVQQYGPQPAAGRRTLDRTSRNIA